MTIGQNAKGEFAGTWISSMADMMFHYKGELDETGNALSLFAEGPHMAEEGKTVEYKDVWTLGDDTLTLQSYAKDEEGNWTLYMTTEGKRKK
jgi:hypothetical protein